MTTLIQLFINFFKTGLFSVGGGLATLPFLYEMSNTTGWFSHTDIANMIAVSESTPGAIGINMSTYAGYTTAGIPGGIVASLGLAAPSLIIIIVIAHMLQKFRESKHVDHAFYGLRPASIAMISAAGLNVAKTALIDMPSVTSLASFFTALQWPSIILAICLFFCMRKFKLHPVTYIAISAVIGIVLQF